MVNDALLGQIKTNHDIPNEMKRVRNLDISRLIDSTNGFFASLMMTFIHRSIREI